MQGNSDLTCRSAQTGGFHSKVADQTVFPPGRNQETTACPQIAEFSDLAVVPLSLDKTSATGTERGRNQTMA